MMANDEIAINGDLKFLPCMKIMFDKGKNVGLLIPQWEARLNVLWSSIHRGKKSS